MRWDQSLTRRQRVILLALAMGVVSVISMLAWSVWSTLGTVASAALPTPPPTLPASATPVPAQMNAALLRLPGGLVSTPAPSPSPMPTFDVYQAGIISAEVADVREVRTRGDTPLTLVDELDMARALYAHYKAQPPLPIRVWPVLETLGLADPKLPLIDVITQAEQVASLYAPETTELFLRRDWDGSITDVETQLAYGYARAFADNYGDLTTLYDGAASLDRRLALAAVAAGDAVVSAWLLNDAMPSEPGPMTDAAATVLENLTRAACPQWRDDNALLEQLSCLDLELGIDFVSSRYWAGGTAAMDAIVLRPPRSTEQLLRPERYAEADEPLVPLSIEPELGTGWALSETETLGEVLMGLVVTSWSEGKVGADAVAGWGGDLLQVWQGPEGGRVAAWQLDWDDSRTAALFHGHLLDLMPRALVRGQIRDTTSPAPLARGRWWSGDQGTIFLYRRANHVWLVWGDDPAAVEAVAVSALP